MELINKKEFAATVLDKNVKTFEIYLATLSAALAIQVYFFFQAQVKLLLTDKAFVKVLSKYLDYTDVFSFDLVIGQFENSSMNEYIIELVKGKYPPYKPIYSLEPIELETLKTYIQTQMKIGFIQLFKSPAGTSIFFN